MSEQIFVQRSTMDVDVSHSIGITHEGIVMMCMRFPGEQWLLNYVSSFIYLSILYNTKLECFQIKKEMIDWVTNADIYH